MATKKSKTTSKGINLCGAIFLVFLILKLAEIGQVANWSWWWVTSPLWIPTACVAAFFIIFGFFFLIGLIFSGGKITIKQGDKEEVTKVSLSNFQKRLKAMSEQRNKNNIK